TNQYIMVLKHNAIEILHNGMKVAHRTKCDHPNGSLFGYDQGFFAISHPAHYDIAAEHAWILPFVPLCLLWKCSIGWLLLRLTHNPNSTLVSTTNDLVSSVT